MTARLLHLHHVTATVGEAQPDLDFYVGALGTRLVKTTVNFDNPAVYHLYYGDERGSPSTLMTTFPYAGWGVPRGVRGAGQIHATSFSVPRGSLAAWQERLAGLGLAPSQPEARFGSASLVVDDPSGLVIELVEDEDRRTPWTGSGVDTQTAIRGVHGVTLFVQDAEPTLRFLTDLLGFRIVGEEGHRTRLAVGDGGPGAYVEVDDGHGMGPARNGIGTVHHVAFAAEDEEAQLAMRERLVEHGVPVTEVRDRQYFQSIYFREPGGVLYEIATMGPGFAIDEAVDRLGETLRLPPWEEPNRATIEGGLTPIHRP